MPRFLVVAHQTASSIELLQAIQNVMIEHPGASFALLVPETPIEDLLEWQEGDSATVAQRVAESATARWEEMGATVIGAKVADPAPVKAIDAEIAGGREGYDGIIIATLPLQRSRWLTLD